MAAKVEIRAPRDGDAEYIGARLRDMDDLECRCFGYDGVRAVALGLSSSSMAWIGETAGEPFVAFGVTPVSVMDRTGRIWMLGTPTMGRVRKDVLRLPPPYIARMRERFALMDNFVHRDNVASIAWLKRMGFAVSGELHDIRGEPFRYFSMKG